MPIVKHINVVHDSNKNYYSNVFKYFDDEKKDHLMKYLIFSITQPIKKK